LEVESISAFLVLCVLWRQFLAAKERKERREDGVMELMLVRI
jgi:hypothetical protein